MTPGGKARGFLFLGCGAGVWADRDDGSPANSNLTLASGEQPTRCNPRCRDFIDFVVQDRRAAAVFVAFEETTFAGDALGDHCAVAARLRVR